MSVFDLIKKLQLTLRLSWLKKIDGQSTASKVKQRNKGARNYAAGRDLHIYEERKQKKSVPFAFFQAAISSNGVNMNIVAGKVHNFSDQHIFVEAIKVLGATYPMRDRPVKPNSEISVHQIGPLPMLEDDTPVYLDLIYKDMEGDQYTARHATELQYMQIDKYKLVDIIRPKPNDIETYKS